jgi:hypothetical protein
MKYPQYTLGLVTGFCLAALYFMLPAIFDDSKQPEEPQQSKGSFTIVDTYKGCDVVQWHYGMLADYKYFLHCNNTRPTYEK